MPLMTPYIFLAPPLILASSEWAPTELCADKSLLQYPLHITCFLHWLLLFWRSPHSTLHRSLRMQGNQHLCRNLKQGNSGADGSGLLSVLRGWLEEDSISAPINIPVGSRSSCSQHDQLDKIFLFWLFLLLVPCSCSLCSTSK